MSWEAFLPSNVQSHPEDFVGPNVAGVIVQCLETGVLINQNVRFWSKARREPRIVRALVAFVSTVALFQTLIAVYNTWRVVVLAFGDYLTVIAISWPDRIQPVLNCTMSAPFQAFLIWRCWNVMARRWIILAPLVPLLLATVAMNIYITVAVFVNFDVSADNIIFTVSTPPKHYSTAFVLTAVLDILITILMMWFMTRIKREVVSRRFARTLARINRILWEAAIPPCACAILACVYYIKDSQKSFWDIFFQSILGKLYVISFFVILNGRLDIRQDKEYVIGRASMRSSRYWVTNALPEFRVDLASMINSDGNIDPSNDTTPSVSNSHSPKLLLRPSLPALPRTYTKETDNVSENDRIVDLEDEMDAEFSSTLPSFAPTPAISSLDLNANTYPPFSSLASQHQHSSETGDETRNGPSTNTTPRSNINSRFLSHYYSQAHFPNSTSPPAADARPRARFSESVSIADLRSPSRGRTRIAAPRPGNVQRPPSILSRSSFVLSLSERLSPGRLSPPYSPSPPPRGDQSSTRPSLSRTVSNRPSFASSVASQQSAITTSTSIATMRKPPTRPQMTSRDSDSGTLRLGEGRRILGEGALVTKRSSIWD